MSVEGLEAQLRADPDDAAAWRVYADWLLAQGDERGELIARGVADERMQPRWRGGIATGWVDHARFGFVIGLHAPAVELPRLLALPEARLVSAVRILGEASHALYAADLGRLRVLDLRYARVGDGLAGLRLAGVRELHLQRNGLGEVGVRALLDGLGEKLELLDLRYNAIGAAGARALAQSPKLARLTCLRLNPEDVEGGAAELARSPYLPVATRRIWRAAS